MAHVIRIASLLVLLILLACSGDDPPEDTSPTDVSEPARTPATAAPPTATRRIVPTQRATLAPTSTREPLPTNTGAPVPTEPMPTEDTGSGAIAPLTVSDPAAVESSLSESEQSCLADTADHERLIQLLNSPDLATPEEEGLLANCLEDEMVLRLFLTRIVGSEILVGQDTSSCLRSGLKGVDLRSIVLSSATDEAQQEVSLALSLSAFLLTVSCLSEDEWAATAPTLDLSPADVQEVECVIDRLGGTDGLTTMLDSVEEISTNALLSVSAECESVLESSAGG